MSGPLFVGVDVGTGSARAGLFDARGRMLAARKAEIAMWREAGDIAEQSSEDIWSAVCACVRGVLDGADAGRVAGIGFDAACSLVVLDREMAPLTVSASGAAERNVIVWMDHRATDQARRINETGHPVLDYVGGAISPEMQTPKLLWLSEEMPETYRGAGQFLDLADFLTWKASGSLVRSLCTVTCKWTYLAHEGRWDPSYFERVGLGDLAAGGFERIGREAQAPGSPLADGLTAEAAGALGLAPGTAVGAGLIDAHAGGIGTVGAAGGGGPLSTMAYVFGTSACTMASSREAHFVPGVWGPYHSAMVPGLWLSEGGQSAAGEAIAHLIATHPARAAVEAAAGEAGRSVQAELLDRLERDGRDALAIAGSRLIVPDFLGNRAPHADPGAKATVSGLGLGAGEDDLLATYAAAVFGVGYGLRQIIEAQRDHGVAPETIAISGGAGASGTVRQMLADACGLPVCATDCAEPVLLGAAMLGAVAAGHRGDLEACMAEMSRIGERAEPSAEAAPRHAARFEAYGRHQAAERDLRAALAG